MRGVSKMLERSGLGDGEGGESMGQVIGKKGEDWTYLVEVDGNSEMDKVIPAYP